MIDQTKYKQGSVSDENWAIFMQIVHLRDNLDELRAQHRSTPLVDKLNDRTSKRTQSKHASAERHRRDDLEETIFTKAYDAWHRMKAGTQVDESFRFLVRKMVFSENSYDADLGGVPVRGYDANAEIIAAFPMR